MNPSKTLSKFGCLFVALSVFMTGCMRESPPKARLFQALVDDDPVAVTQAIKDGASVSKNFIYDDRLMPYLRQDTLQTWSNSMQFEYTPLCFAVAAGREKAVKALLDQGADPNQIPPPLRPPYPSRLGVAPLHLCSSLPIAKMLIDKGADVNLPSTRGYAGSSALRETPLMLAASGLRLELIKFLLENGADVNARDDEGQTALRYVNPVRKDIRQLLIAHGADPNNSGPSPSQLQNLRKKLGRPWMTMRP